jgi:hypothetical protein
MMQNHSGLMAKYSLQPRTRTIPRDLTPEHPLELTTRGSTPSPMPAHSRRSFIAIGTDLEADPLLDRVLIMLDNIALNTGSAV